MHSLIVFASGKGSNAAAIIAHFKKIGTAKTVLIVTNKPDAGVLDIARQESIPHLIIDKVSFREAELINTISAFNPSLIILAGFLWKIPDPMIRAFSNKIINIHPALLPEFGGKGMYGNYVHQAVLAAGKKESGISIHFVDERYDNGAIILQARCPISDSDDANSLAARIHELEHFYFPRTIEFLLDSGSHDGNRDTI